MNISHIEHVGIAVTSLEEAIPFYENMLRLFLSTRTCWASSALLLKKLLTKR